MKKSKSLKKNVLPFNLQFFAESDPGAGSQSNNTIDNAQQQQGSQNHSNQGSGEQIFTQSQVSAMMAREKKEGKESVLKSLGFGSEKEAKDAMKLLQALTDSQKTDGQKAKDEVTKAQTAQQDAEKRAKVAEDKLAMVQKGVKADCLDDVYAIAALKVSNDKDLSKVLEEMKKDTKYSVFFTPNNDGSSPEGNQHNTNNQGTGSSFGSNGGSQGNSGGNAGNYGANLAQRSSQQGATKKSFFS